MPRTSVATIVVAALGVTLLAQPTPPRLFADIEFDGSIPEALGSVRSRAAGVDLDLIGGVDGTLAPVQRLRLNLFPGTDLVATLDRYEESESGGTWSGIIDGTAFGDVILVNVNGFVSGRVSAFGRSYAIRGHGGVATITEIDEDLLPESEDDAVDPTPTEAGDLDLDASADDGSVIDIGVIYSVDSAAAAGGDEAIQADIRVAVQVANNAFLWSGVDTRLQLQVVGRYTGGDSGNLIRDLINAALGSANIHRFRNSHGLDLIALVAENDRGRCGAAFVNDLNATGRLAHSITNRQCLLTHTFAHEIGHNLGARHDWYLDDRSGAYAFSHGHVDPELGFRTIMSYRHLCLDTGKECPRITWFSNPRINVLATSRFVGVPEGTDTSCRRGDAGHYRCDADSARSFDAMRRIVARFR